MRKVCYKCGEERLAALKEEDGNTVCYSCSGRYNQGHYQSGSCFTCGSIGPVEKHHVFGRKIHPVTVNLCPNDHRVISAGKDEMWGKMLPLLVVHIFRQLNTTNINQIDWKEE